jgi:hypothetical protein
VLNQKPSTSVDETALEHLLDKSRDITELITVATLLGDTQVLLDLQAKLLKKLKNEFEDMLESRNLSELFGAAFILSKQDHAFMDGQLVARLVTLLTQSEVALGGPYTSKNGKSDLITNIFIALFLQSQDVKLSNLTIYIWAQLEDDTFFKNSERSIILYFASHLNEADSSLLKKLAVDVYLLEPEYGVLLNARTKYFLKL